MVLETDRLRLREMTLADAPFLLELMNEPAFIQNVADRGLRTTADAERWMSEKVLPSYTRYGFGFYLVELKESSVPLGICGLVKREVLDDPDVGYAILTRHSGNGYAYEAAAAVMTYGRKTLGLRRIIGVTSAKNAASIRILEKLGLRFERMVKLPQFEKPSMLFS